LRFNALSKAATNSRADEMTGKSRIFRLTFVVYVSR